MVKIITGMLGGSNQSVSMDPLTTQSRLVSDHNCSPTISLLTQTNEAAQQAVPHIFPDTAKPVEGRVTLSYPDIAAEPFSLIAKISRWSRNFFYSKFKGEAPRKPEVVNAAMRAMGAEPLNLVTSKGVPIKGMHFTVEAFAKKMQAAGAQRVIFVCKNSGPVPAIVVENANPCYEVLMTSMCEMGFFNKEFIDEKTRHLSLTEGIWEKREIDGKTYIWTKENFIKMRGCFIKIAGSPKKQQFINTKVSVDPSSLRPISCNNTYTVVLNGGLWSRFESFHTASEVAKLLALGLNIVISEDKSPGIIDTESRENVMAHREVIYQDLQSKGVPNENIIWKGTCFSSIPAVEAAAKYKDSHVVIDQGYVSSREIVQTRLPTLLRPFSPFVGLAVRSLDFDYEMEPYLSQETGEVVIIANGNDGVVPKDHLLRIKTALHSKAFASFEIDETTVLHAGGWFRDAKCSKAFTEFLVQKGWSAGEIIG